MTKELWYFAFLFLGTYALRENATDSYVTDGMNFIDRNDLVLITDNVMISNNVYDGALLNFYVNKESGDVLGSMYGINRNGFDDQMLVEIQTVKWLYYAEMNAKCVFVSVDYIYKSINEVIMLAAISCNKCIQYDNMECQILEWSVNVVVFDLNSKWSDYHANNIARFEYNVSVGNINNGEILPKILANDDDSFTVLWNSVLNYTTSEYETYFECSEPEVCAGSIPIQGRYEFTKNGQQYSINSMDNEWFLVGGPFYRRTSYYPSRSHSFDDGYYLDGIIGDHGVNGEHLVWINLYNTSSMNSISTVLYNYVIQGDYLLGNIDNQTVQGYPSSQMSFLRRNPNDCVISSHVFFVHETGNNINGIELRSYTYKDGVLPAWELRLDENSPYPIPLPQTNINNDAYNPAIATLLYNTTDSHIPSYAEFVIVGWIQYSLGIFANMFSIGSCGENQRLLNDRDIVIQLKTDSNIIYKHLNIKAYYDIAYFTYTVYNESNGNSYIQAKQIQLSDYIDFVQTGQPTVNPTISPTITPTTTPTMSPTITPTIDPTNTPTIHPTKTPTKLDATMPPTLTPTQTPTKLEPTITPTETPTVSDIITNATISPTKTPTETPTVSEACEYIINVWALVNTTIDPGAFVSNEYAELLLDVINNEIFRQTTLISNTDYASQFEYVLDLQNICNECNVYRFTIQFCFFDDNKFTNVLERLKTAIFWGFINDEYNIMDESKKVTGGVTDTSEPNTVNNSELSTKNMIIIIIGGSVFGCILILITILYLYCRTHKKLENVVDNVNTQSQLTVVSYESYDNINSHINMPDINSIPVPLVAPGSFDGTTNGGGIDTQNIQEIATLDTQEIIALEGVQVGDQYTTNGPNMNRNNNNNNRTRQSESLYENPNHNNDDNNVGVMTPQGPSTPEAPEAPATPPAPPIPMVSGFVKPGPFMTRK